MEIEEHIINITKATYPNYDIFMADKYEFNSKLSNTQGIRFPVLFLDKQIVKDGEIGTSGFSKENSRITIIALNKPVAFEPPVDEQLALNRAAADILRTLMIKYHRFAWEGIAAVHDKYNITPVFFRFDAHLIGASLQFTVDYYPDIKYC